MTQWAPNPEIFTSDPMWTVGNVENAKKTIENKSDSSFCHAETTVVNVSTCVCERETE